MAWSGKKNKSIGFDYQGKSVGFAKVMAEVPVSDGAVAEEILNFSLNEKGFLDSTFRIMPIIPDEWRPSITQPGVFKLGIVGMKYMLMHGHVPQLLMLGSDGVYTFDPSVRGDTSGNPGLTQQYYYLSNNTKVSVYPQSELQFPPQMQQIGNRVYFTFCDGGGAWVWDGIRLRKFGFTDTPSSVDVLGPTRHVDWEVDEQNANQGGFCPKGRIGHIDSGMTDATGSVLGGIEEGRWKYAVAFENVDGAYSATGHPGGIAEIHGEMADANGDGEFPPERLTRRFWVREISVGSDETVARILVRTRNLLNLAPGDLGNFFYLHRISNNKAVEWIDDIPDGELAFEWEDREPVPIGFYFMRYHSGSMFIMRNDAHPSRVWWSEQTGIYGPIPESFLRGHWREVFPETGPITGSVSVNVKDLDTTLLIFKESAVHYCTGNYPNWTFGTLRHGSGCAGPNLVQSVPDGSVIWYGSRTFWRLTHDGAVTDIGTPLKKRLAKINYQRAQVGVSWIDRKFGEVSFVLPSDDSARPDLHFVYDYRLGGWRIRDHMTVDAVETIGNTDVTFVSGTFHGTRTVWAANRGYPGYSVTNPTASFISGWVSYEEFGPNLHGTYRSAELVYTLGERCSSTASVVTKSDWDPDTEINSESIKLMHPENDDIAFYGDGTGAAVYDVAFYREQRVYAHRLAIDVPSSSVFRIEVSGTEPIAIMNIDMYGAPISLPGGRTPGLDDGDAT